MAHNDACNVEKRLMLLIKISFRVVVVFKLIIIILKLICLPIRSVNDNGSLDNRLRQKSVTSGTGGDFGASPLTDNATWLPHPFQHLPKGPSPQT